jgi:hypothetical protein
MTGIKRIKSYDDHRFHGISKATSSNPALEISLAERAQWIRYP